MQLVVLRNGIEPLLASRGGDRLAFPNQSETQHIKPGEGKERQTFTGERRNMLVDTHAGKMTKPRVQAIPLREAAKLPVYIISLVKW
mgnify:FL=1